MKVTKSELKAIVKECLVEILNEGLGGMTAPKIPAKGMQVTQPLFSENTRRPAASKPSPKAAAPRSHSPQLSAAIKAEAGGNAIMESILADTAASTLPKMLQNEGKTPIPSTAGGGLAESVVAESSPEDLFGDEAASKWANLAFMGSTTKK